MNKQQAFMSGAVGAVVVTVVHETARHVIPHAPRVDVLGMRAIAASVRTAGQTPPSRTTLYWLALLGDLISNALYYSLVGYGQPKHIWRRGLLLGAAAGLCAVFLPRPIGLGRQPNQSPPATQIMTFLWYLLGGCGAAASAHTLVASAASEKERL